MTTSRTTHLSIHIHHELHTSLDHDHITNYTPQYTCSSRIIHLTRSWPRHELDQEWAMERLKTAETQKELPEDPHELDRRDRLRSRLEGMSAEGSFKGVSRTLSSTFHELYHLHITNTIGVTVSVADSRVCLPRGFSKVCHELYHLHFTNPNISRSVSSADSNSYHLSCTR